MYCHSQLCKPALVSVDNDDDEWEEESNIDDNGGTMMTSSLVRIDTALLNSCH